MGLDTSHDCFHGPYSAFDRLRKAWAQAADLPPLELMEGFYRGLGEDIMGPFALLGHLAKAQGPNSLVGGAHAAIKREVLDKLPIKWESLKPSALHILLCHSDCEGSIKAKDCIAIAESLEAILPNIPEDEIGMTGWGHRERTQKFIDGLRLAAGRRESVKFS